ncbi:MAG: DsbA family protein [Polyangiales bacterium]
MSPTLPVVYYFDLLCVWAYVGRIRVDELRQTFGEGVTLDYRFVSVFGDARRRLAARWADKGGMAGYAAHVRSVVAGFDHVALHPDTWEKVAPYSSGNAHMFLAAVRLLDAEGGAPAFDRAVVRLQRAFFGEARDVGARQVLFEVAEELDLPRASLARLIDSGAAHAELARDAELAREQAVTMSPTLVLNEGRQRLVGNVGYRVIEANVRELLNRPGEQHSWC